MYDLSTLLKKCTSLYQPIFYKLLAVRLPALTPATLSVLMERLSLGEWKVCFYNERTYSDAEYLEIKRYICLWARVIRWVQDNQDYDSSHADAIKRKDPYSFCKLMIYLDYFKEKKGLDSGIKAHQEKEIAIADLFRPSVPVSFPY